LISDLTRSHSHKLLTSLKINHYVPCPDHELLHHNIRCSVASVYQADYSGNAFTLQPSIQHARPKPSYPTGRCHPLGTSKDLSSLLRKYNSGVRSKCACLPACRRPFDLRLTTERAAATVSIYSAA